MADAYTRRAPFLECDQSFRDASQDLIDATCNGCGARDGIDVPDTIWGLSITRACNVHDWDYQRGISAQMKDIADDRFRRNLQKLIDHAYSNSGWLLRFTNIRRLLRCFGGGERKPTIWQSTTMATLHFGQASSD